MGLIRNIYGSNSVVLTDEQTSYSGLTVNIASIATPMEYLYNAVVRSTRGVILPILEYTKQFCDTKLLIDNDSIAIYAQRRYKFNATYTYTQAGSTTPTTRQEVRYKYLQVPESYVYNPVPLPFGFARIFSLQNSENDLLSTISPLHAAILRGSTVLASEDNIPQDTIVDYVVNNENAELVLMGSDTSMDIIVNSLDEGCAKAILWYIDDYGLYQPLLLRSIKYGDASHDNELTRHIVAGATAIYPSLPERRTFTAEFTGNKKLYDNLVLTGGDVFYLGFPDNTLLPIDSSSVARNGLVITFNGVIGL
jgi:hypothetical protein